ncbi:DNA polymerase III subunit alpha [Aureibacter tunicatorum]|uniref:DNA polymerase III subunit alpha n=1 Tax=Aureibacter tunicatorum TaxID=866807 RepID=A0AAE3XMD8_9BACT|nr:DNA polymerase III subunit alpha [Aureibacter tunicatorum]MDR6237634.1 DNA polymerase-3 subunit alpha [Aureibacter tunicatorum]BDD02669.1 DNA-directed DNA polymerase [Aureibacter tunicatorum]
MYLVYDTETTGLPKNFSAPITDHENWPRLVQLAWQIHDEKGDLVEVKNFIVKPDGFTIPFNAEKIHGISTKRAMKQGMPLDYVLEEFSKAVEKSKFVVGHNIGFDVNIMGAEYDRREWDTGLIMDMPVIDTKDEATDYCAIPGGRGGKFKWPTLTELHTKLFGEAFAEAHNASADVEATARCFLELIRIDVIGHERLGTTEDVIKVFKDNNPKTIELIGLNIEPYTPDNVEFAEEDSDSGITSQASDIDLTDIPYSHLHVHSQYSVLQATCQIGGIVNKAKEDGMPAVALTDHGNMMAAFHFVRDALKAEIKPILGCEYYVAEDYKKRQFTKDNPDRRFNQVLIAKHKEGYHNLAKMSSLAYIDGLYAGYPRIDKELIKEYKEGLMAFTGSLNGEIPNLILNVGEEKAEEAFKWWHEQFGDDFYVELIRHGLPEEDHVNEVLFGFAQKYGVKYFASNNVYYENQDGSNAHDILLCVKDGEKQSTPIGKGRGFRYGFPNDQFYFKSQADMKELFKDLPEAIVTTNEIVEKCESYKLAREVLLPAFDIPEQFIDPKDEEDGGKRGENAFLKHLTFEGAKKRYDEITPEIKERLDFELMIIEKTGYPGYFLIVQDFTSAAREMGVSVGPGRGSAAGSAVAYCIGITNVDPIAYDLLFERFLNPDRVSLPDIDIDFDDEGRQRIINWVVDKYGFNQVSHIITYGTMAAKSSIRDTARVLDLPLPDADRIAKLVPDMKLKKLFGMDDRQLSDKLNSEQMDMAHQLKSIAAQPNLEGEVVSTARVLEGSVRNTGIHACGVIITPDDIRKFIPVSTAKDADLLVTQFDNSVVEDAGMLKMDFLGLKTLSIIKDAIRIVKERHSVEIDPDEIPLDDSKTYELYQRGETNGTFQFESPGMQKHLKALKPDKFGDLIAMNALYRPGPLEYIPNFIARKHGQEPIIYDLGDMEEYLAETYGITVYQEQVMLLSQKLAGFTKGEADMLRKAMGKKIFALLEKLKPKFIDGGKERGHDEQRLNKIWKDWEAFAAYAFNKSHSTCYSVVAFHTGYLKANYPAEYMASVLTHNMNDIKKVTFFMEECQRMGIPVLGPDVNESQLDFTVNNNGEIRFGLGAIKGVGEGAVEVIIKERSNKGSFNSIFDLTKRIDLRSANKKTLENLALAGAFDSFQNIHRAQFFAQDQKGLSLLEKSIKFGASHQESENSVQTSLFGGDSGVQMPEPEIPTCEEWSTMDKLNKEKEVVGIYISGHPLDDYRLELENFCNQGIADLSKDNPESLIGKEITIGGCVSQIGHRFTKKGQPFGTLTVEDYSGSFTFFLFSEDYVRFKQYMVEGWFLFIKGKMQRQRWDETRIDFKISQIELLSDVKDKYCKGFKISVNVQELDEGIAEFMTEIPQKHPGSIPYHIELIDRGNQIQVDTMSRNYTVNPDSKLLEELKQYPELKCKLI